MNTFKKYAKIAKSLDCSSRLFKVTPYLRDDMVYCLQKRRLGLKGQMLGSQLSMIFGETDWFFSTIARFRGAVWRVCEKVSGTHHT